MEEKPRVDRLAARLAACRKEMADLERLFSIVPAMICIADKAGHFHYLNQEWEATLGFSREALMSTSLFELIHPDDQAATTAEIQRQLEGGATLSFENRYRCEDGGYKILKWRATPARDEKLYAVAEDVTARRRTEAAHRESENRYRSLVENTLDGYFVAEAGSGRFIFLNRSICDLFGYTMEEGLGLTFWDVMDPADHQVIRERVQARLEDRQPRFADNIYTGLRKDGTRFDVEISTSLVSYEGRPALQGILKDITEKERLRRQLEQAQKMESIGRLAGGVAHDFNNMLSVIGGYAELALEKAGAVGGLREDLGEILKAARRSADITRQLLAFARQQAIAPQVLDLNESIEGTLKMLRRMVSEDIDLIWHPKVGLWPVKIDPVQVDQILANLCVNARDAIEGVGRIVIETDMRTIESADTAAQPDAAPGDFVMLAIRDNGGGMDQETLDHIFEPFFTTKGLGRGTGLGLATVYGIVKQNNGFIDVTSGPGEGTTFQIFLPRHHAPAMETGRAIQAEIPAGRGETILLVEDEASILKLGRIMLESLGYDVLTAASPEDAITVLEGTSGNVDLLLTDVVMPGMSGADLSDQLRSSLPGLKTLFMSGYAAGAIAHRGILREDADFVQKPFSKRELAVKVRAALEG